MKGYERGYSAYKTEENCLCKMWKDNTIVSFASSYVGLDPIVQVKRWDKKLKQHVFIPRPAVITQYNLFMGGIDLLSMCSTLYK